MLVRLVLIDGRPGVCQYKNAGCSLWMCGDKNQYFFNACWCNIQLNNFIITSINILSINTFTIRMANLIGLDSQILSTIFFRGWSVIAGAVMVFFLPIWLGRVEQGYYYTFASLVALQIFFELGMNQVILQLVSHDFAHLRREADNSLSGDAGRIARLSSLIKLLHRWYLTAAILFFVIVSVCGALFLSDHGELSSARWLGPWVVLTLSTAINLYLSALLTVLEGSGELAGVARMRLAQSMIGYLLMWGGLSLGAALWAVPLIPLAAAVYTLRWLQRHDHPLLQFRKSTQLNCQLPNWRRDIFPFQWRIALSWMSGYFIFQLFTPIAFAKQGPVEAGRLGITLAVFNALLTVGMSWVNAKSPLMAAHISRNERLQLNILFVSVTRRSMIFTALMATMAIVALALLGKISPAAANRFASVPVASCIAVVTLINTFIFSAAGYMRAHKEEPMLWASVVSGLATLLATAVGSSFGVLPMMLLYMLVTICVSLPWTIRLFMPYYKKYIL